MYRIAAPPKPSPSPRPRSPSFSSLLPWYSSQAWVASVVPCLMQPSGEWGGGFEKTERGEKSQQNHTEEQKVDQKESNRKNR